MWVLTVIRDLRMTILLLIVGAVAGLFAVALGVYFAYLLYAGYMHGINDKP